jgi:hypothetical protein
MEQRCGEGRVRLVTRLDETRASGEPDGLEDRTDWPSRYAEERVDAARDKRFDQTACGRVRAQGRVLRGVRGLGPGSELLDVRLWPRSEAGSGRPILCAGDRVDETLL